MTGFLRLEHIQCILDRDKENDIVIEAEIMRASAQPGAGHWQGDCTRHRRSSYSEVCYIHSFIPFHFCTSVYLFHQKSIAYFHTLEVIIGKCARCCPRSWCRPATSLHIGAGIAFTQYWAGHLTSPSTRHCCNLAKIIHAHHLLLQLEIFWSHIVCQITSWFFNTLILVIKYC